MFTFLIQLVDLIKLHQVGLFLVFFICSWSIYIIKLLVRRRNPLTGVMTGAMPTSVTAIVPVVDEPIEVWETVLSSLHNALIGIKKSEVIVVANGVNGHECVEIAKEYGYKVVKLPMAGKRAAIKKAVDMAKGEVTVILDSDTVVGPSSIEDLLVVFQDQTVGGATARHRIIDRNKNIFRRVSDWLEDIRFEEVVRGQSSYGSVSCLPGRLLAVRTDLLQMIAPALVNQKFLGKKCISGDDRFLTSEILKLGYKTVFVPFALVLTEAPDTLKKFVLQRLRWSRTSLRESLRSVTWAFKYPFMAFTVFSTIIMRWFFFAVIVTAILSWLDVIERVHYWDFSILQIVVFTTIGFFISGFIRNIRHFISYPEDIKYLPVYLLITTFILTPVEWYGNITIQESGWMTRKVK